jgi:hypothetical protein
MRASGMASISERESREIEAANASGNNPGRLLQGPGITS